jgi:hypothetical protein
MKNKNNSRISAIRQLFNTNPNRFLFPNRLAANKGNLKEAKMTGTIPVI